MDRLNEINAELNAWMRDVVKLYDEEAAEDPDFAKVTGSIKDFLDNYDDETNGYKGYPLDLDAWEEVFKAYNGVVAGLEGDEDPDKVAYVKDAKEVLGDLNTKSDEVITSLNGRIAALAQKIEENNGNLMAEDIDEVAAIEDLYNALHKTQQAKVVGYDDVLADARETIVAVEAFKDMINSLYAEVVTNKNVTSFVQFYIDVVRTTFAQFPNDIRRSFDDSESVNYIAPNGYTKNMEEIQAAYDAALEAGTVVRLSELKDAFEKAQKELLDALNGLGQVDGEVDTKSALQQAFETFENRITSAYTQKIEGDLDSLKTELQGLITAEQNAREAGDTAQANALKEAREALEESINQTKTSLEAAIAKESTDRAAALDEVNKNLEAAKTDLEGKITALKTDLEKQLGDLKTELQGLITAEQNAREAGDTAQANALKEAREALEAAIAEAEAAIDAANAAIAKEGTDRAAALADLTSKVNAAQAAADKANAAIDQLRQDMEKADAELKQEIDSLKSTSTTLTILVIVLGVLILAAIACIVILFIKRK